MCKQEPKGDWHPPRVDVKARTEGGLAPPSGMRMFISLFCFFAGPDERFRSFASYRGIYVHMCIYIFIHIYICPDNASESRCRAAQWAAQRRTVRSRVFCVCGPSRSASFLGHDFTHLQSAFPLFTKVIIHTATTLHGRVLVPRPKEETSRRNEIGLP